MCRLVLVIKLSLLSFVLQAQELPQLSPQTTIQQNIGLTDFTVVYSRPSRRGREIIGENGLVQNGKIWRTGADEATVIQFSDPVHVQGKKLLAGSYSLFSIPESQKWIIIFNKNSKQWGALQYKPEEEVLRIEVPIQKSEFTETFTIEWANLKEDKADLILKWEEIAVPISFELPTRNKALNNIDNELLKGSLSSGQYFTIAKYYVTHKIRVKDALKFALKGDEGNKYWVIRTLSEAYALNKDFKNAIKHAKRSLELSEKNKNWDYVKINKDNIRKWRKTE